LSCLNRIKSESDTTGNPAIQKMVEQELVHAIEAVLNTKKNMKMKTSKVRNIFEKIKKKKL